ncbi:unnamed protein product [Caenorhabditis brenneri]
MTSNTGIVKLNIGGTVFQTTKSTLTRFDGFFKTILETDVPVNKDENGAFFIDRSPKHFDLILNFMRDADVELPNCQKEIKEIFKEAQYYLLNGLVELCSTHTQNEPDNEIFKTLNSDSERDSAILNSKKPVLITYTSGAIVDYINGQGYNEWKQFIKKNSPKWNIFFKEKKETTWCIHYNGETFSNCYVYSSKEYKCGYPYFCNRSDIYFHHLDYHMNRCLTHPENMHLKYEEYSKFLLNQ